MARNERNRFKGNLNKKIIETDGCNPRHRGWGGSFWFIQSFLEWTTCWLSLSYGVLALSVFIWVAEANVRQFCMSLAFSHFLKTLSDKLLSYIPVCTTTWSSFCFSSVDRPEENILFKMERTALKFWLQFFFWLTYYTWQYIKMKCTTD